MSVQQAGKAALAAEFDEIESMEELIAEGCDVYTAMCAGAQYGRRDIVELCMAKGARCDGYVAVRCVESKNLELFRAIMRHLEPVDVEDCVDECMDGASAIGWVEGVVECLRRGATDSWNCAMVAANAGHVGVLEVLTEGLGEDALADALAAAIAGGSKEAAGYLAGNVWVYMTDEAMEDLAHLNDAEMAELVFQIDGFDVDIVADEAAASGKFEVLRWCLLNYADPHSAGICAANSGCHTCFALCRSFFNYTGMRWRDVHAMLPWHAHKMRYFRKLDLEIMEKAWHPSRVLDWCIDIEELGVLEECFEGA